MDIYGISTPDYFRIDDLLDFSNDQISSTSDPHLLSSPQDSSIPRHYPSADSFTPPPSTNFTHHLSVPSDDAAELEWLSQFVDDSFMDFEVNSSLAGTVNPTDMSFCGKAHSKRSKGVVTDTSPWISSPASTAIGKTKSKKETTRASSPTDGGGGVRRCTHCASEKTPQWRMGPLGPKTLCNACGVRYKSGRLVPEYRPAASPTFVLTQHSNSHRKVLELRRQKEMLRQQQESQQQEEQTYL